MVYYLQIVGYNTVSSFPALWWNLVDFVGMRLGMGENDVQREERMESYDDEKSGMREW